MKQFGVCAAVRPAMLVESDEVDIVVLCWHRLEGKHGVNVASWPKEGGDKWRVIRVDWVQLPVNGTVPEFHDRPSGMEFDPLSDFPGVDQGYLRHPGGETLEPWVGGNALAIVNDVHTHVAQSLAREDMQNHVEGSLSPRLAIRKPWNRALAG